MISERLQRQLSRLRQDRNGGAWDISVRGKAPHKPLMLLAVADLIEAGFIRENLIPFNQRLLTAFDGYWNRCCGNRITNPLQPYWYLKGDGFWTLQAKSGHKQVLDAMVVNGRVPPLRRAEELIDGASLDPELFEALQTDVGRAEFRNLLIATFFSGEIQQILAEQHAIIVKAAQCEHVLRLRLDQKLADIFIGDDALNAAFTEESRSLAFRSVVVEAYGHTCSICEAHIRTPSGRSAVQAAHIVPFSICKNNDPRNGLALCPLHHWAFDQGMLAVAKSLTVRIHPYAGQMPADSGFRALHGRNLKLPEDPRMRPAESALAWHLENVYEKIG